MTRIICIGLNPAIDRVLSIPHFHAGGVHQAEIRAFQPAGKATNVARVLGLLGQSCTLAGFIGASEEAMFADSFAGLPVDVCLTKIPGRTRINTTILDPHGQDTHLREAGFSVTEGDFSRLRDTVYAIANPHDWCVFSGSIAPGMDQHGVKMWMEALLARGVRVAVDSSGKLLEAIRGVGVTLLKVNREEFGEYVGDVTPAADAFLPWMRETLAKKREISAQNDEKTDLHHSVFDSKTAQKWPETLLISDGPHGGGIFNASSMLWASVPDVTVVSTVGAGDACLAGFLAGEGLTAENQLARALACGTAATLDPLAGVIDVAKMRVFEREILRNIRAID